MSSEHLSDWARRAQEHLKNTDYKIDESVITLLNKGLPNYPGISDISPRVRLKDLGYVYHPSREKTKLGATPPEEWTDLLEQIDRKSTAGILELMKDFWILQMLVGGNAGDLLQIADIREMKPQELIDLVGENQAKTITNLFRAS